MKVHNESSGHRSTDSEAVGDYELSEEIAQQLKRNEAGLVPAIVQSERGEVLMLAWMDDHALAYTLATRRGTYYSRSRREYWIKGLTSGNTQEVVGARLDCDGDTVLLTVRQHGGACHTGDRTCFDARDLFGEENNG
ncbi:MULTISPECIES: phosphoribosyl-AMP cyclohydrolase [Corynebacterium]|uniref:Phosphoribosyl-AMP cyclohydrolase n=1 Tax=Corynebacterium aurimucosum TaxID=169292 RepID=A0A558GJ85_9CORY|nr:phosphoribosyl-AMP cyclohydrolase [Corynebacterium sp. HMSC062A03]OFP22878.1 phosphoribosyl-AMP cyclohydrolase [Corynebacterium sp. HMSC066C02]OFQ36161.1 phosphoribosyl-AMP cyclohydrolase [Corynebacterium sp. HMSC072D12]OFS36950.1 phosphoribosyl-AMP cyclohydrolase [Corynebacterium sp. HMSC069E04]OFT66155.1 phosphoribosyl-AMP cyclohydrolase [Corynebacterium sp. HMSC05D03]TVU56931.1 phosphoribosyl-AMP cyclohydrolase [Corynebacterium aurimucosum]